MSTAYFLGKDAWECLQGRCDPAAFALDAVGILPLVPALGAAAHAGKAAWRSLNAMRVGRLAHSNLERALRTVWRDIGLVEGVNFFLNKAIRHADDPSRIVSKLRPDVLVCAVEPGTGRKIAIVLDFKSSLTRPKTYAGQLEGYRTVLRDLAGYDEVRVLPWLY